MAEKLQCEEVWWEVSNYIDGTVAVSLKRRMDEHFAECRRCRAGTAERVRCGLERNLELIPMGITEDRIQLGSHLIYFWESDDDFKRGVKFLNRGLGQSDHCIVFGHDEAIERVLANLAADGFDTQRLISELQLTVLPRRKSAQHTLSDISDVVQAALQAGARAVRFLGNLGMGRAPSAS